MKDYFSLSSLFILLTFPLEGQVNSSIAIHQKDAKKKFELSLFWHKSYGGPLKDIQASMISSQTGPSSDPFVTYPLIKVKTPISFGLKYNISQRSGISLCTERLDVFTVIRDSESPWLKSILGATSLNYVYGFGHNRHELTSGIALMSYRMKPHSRDRLTSTQDRTKNFGINFGYSFHMIESKWFYLALQTQYTLTGSSSISPYTIYEPARYINLLGIIMIESPERTTSFPATKVNLNTFNIGVSIGFRFGKDVACVQY